MSRSSAGLRDAQAALQVEDFARQEHLVDADEQTPGERRVRAADGVARAIRLTGVHALDVSSFREANTILSMMVVPAAEADRFAGSEIMRRLGWGQMPKLKNHCVFVLDSSYGAEVVADCADVVLEGPA